jgi:hypothetical protein
MKNIVRCIITLLFIFFVPLSFVFPQDAREDIKEDIIYDDIDKDIAETPAEIPAERPGFTYKNTNSGGHKSHVTSIIHSGENAITCDEEGFIVIWDLNQEKAIDRYQLTPYKIASMVKHPVENEICILESIDTEHYRISVWDIENKEKIFSIRLAKRINYINYSAGGSFIIAAESGGSQILIINSINGETISAIDIPRGKVTLGITGRSERNMLLYQEEYEDSASKDSGQILYINVPSRTITGVFHAPGGLANPIIFGNNRFLTGIDPSGLVLADAASGDIFDTLDTIKRDALLYPASDGFFCLSHEENTLVLYRFTIDARGHLLRRHRTVLSFSAGLSSAEQARAFAVNNSVIIVHSNGSLTSAGFYAGVTQRFEQKTRAAPFAFSNFKTRITEIAASNTHIALLTESNDIVFLPADYALLETIENIHAVNLEGYTNISVFSDTRFILWQSENIRNLPVLLEANIETGEIFSRTTLRIMPARFPIRAISVKNNNLLVLDRSGNINIRKNINSGEELAVNSRAAYTFSSVGAMDAAIIDENYFILSRSVIREESPFLIVNYNTGETIQVKPSKANVEAGLIVAPVESGNICVSLTHNETGVETVVSKVSSDTYADDILLDYPGESINTSIAESGGNTAIALGSLGAKIYGETIVELERTSGLPVKLAGNEKYFIIIDSEGSVAWHDNTTGDILAVFSLDGDTWTLSSETGASGTLSRDPDSP